MSNTQDPCTEIGLKGILWVPCGLHACHFYDSRNSLIETALPFLLAGLYCYEKCIWVTAPPLCAEEASAVLGANWPGEAHARAVDALRLVDFRSWYAFQATDSLADALLREEQLAIRDGYAGLRVLINTAALLPAERPTFMEHEQSLSRKLLGSRVVVLCSYYQTALSSHQAASEQAGSAHHCICEQGKDGWQMRWGEPHACAS